MVDLSQKQLSLVCRVSKVHIKLESLISMCFFRAPSPVLYRRLAEAVLQPAGSLALSGRIPEILWERESAVLHSAGRKTLLRASEISWARFAMLGEQIQEVSVSACSLRSFMCTFLTKNSKDKLYPWLLYATILHDFPPHRIGATKQS